MLRGVAVLGIYWINVLLFGLPSGGYALPSYVGDAVNLNIGLWAFSEIMVDGAMRGLFSCLFGASALLYLSDSKISSNGPLRIEYYYRRNMVLVLIGLIHAYILLWPYDVLYAYGLLGLLLFPLRRLSAQVLIITGCILLITGDITFISHNKTDQEQEAIPHTAEKSASVSTPHVIKKSAPLTESTVHKSNPPASTEADTQDEKEEEYTQQEKYRLASIMNMEDDIALHKSSYLVIFKSKLNSIIEQQTLFMYSAHFFDIGGMMLIGMALLKLGILQGTRSKKFYLSMLLIGFVTGILIRTPTVYLEVLNEFVPDDPENPVKLNFGFSRLPIMLGYIGLFLWLSKFTLHNWLVVALTSIGKMALTNYIMQTFISVFIFYGFGFALIGYFERYQLLLICIIMWFLQITYSYYWLKYYRYGPLEWLWRSATYLQWQPLRKNSIP